MQTVYIRAAELGGPFSHRPQLTLREQMIRAGRRAMASAQLPAAQESVDALFMAAMGGFDTEEFVGLLPLRVAGDLALRRAEIVPMLMGTSEAGAWALRHAFEAVRRGGEYETVLVIAGEQMNPLATEGEAAREPLRERIRRNQVITQVLDDSDAAYGLNMVRVGDLFMDLLATQLRINGHDLHHVLLPLLSLSKYRRAARYPMAHFHKAPIRTFEEFITRPRITTHFNLHDVTPTTTGAVAVVLSVHPPGDGSPAVALRSMGQAFVPISPAHREGDLGLSRAIREALARACKPLRVPVRALLDVDFAIIHDAFPSIEMFFLKELGLELPGIVERLLSGWSNPFGGLKACGHALGASGLLQIAKAMHRFQQNPRYILPAAEGDMGAPGDSIAFTTSVGAALTNVIASVLTCARPGLPDPIERLAADPDGEELAEYRRRTFEHAGWDARFTHLGADEGAVLCSTHLRHTPSFGDDETPLLSQHANPWVHLVQRGDRTKTLAWSDAPLLPGQPVHLEPLRIGRGDLMLAAPAPGAPLPDLQRRPTDAHVHLWIAQERRLQPLRERPLRFMDVPLRLTPHLLAYAQIGAPQHTAAAHVVRLKARAVTSELDSLDLRAPAPLGRALTVTLIQPVWQDVQRWLPELWAESERRAALIHPHLPRLWTWTVLPNPPDAVLRSLHPEAPNPPFAPVIAIVRDFVEGATLAEPGHSQARRLDHFFQDALAVTAAVEELHQFDLYGRGVGPEALVRAPHGGLILLDSPWAELPSQAPPPGAALFDPAPERITRDLNGLGRILLRLYTGKLLPADPDATDALSALLQSARVDLATFLIRLLASRGRDRFHSVSDARRALERLAASHAHTSPEAD